VHIGRGVGGQRVCARASRLRHKCWPRLAKLLVACAEDPGIVSTLCNLETKYKSSMRTSWDVEEGVTWTALTCSSGRAEKRVDHDTALSSMPRTLAAWIACKCICKTYIKV